MMLSRILEFPELLVVESPIPLATCAVWPQGLLLECESPGWTGDMSLFTDVHRALSYQLPIRSISDFIFILSAFL